jgi:hypothetical protein
MVMGEILNILIKQHQRGRWRYLSLLAQTIAHASQLLPKFH